MDLPDFNPQGTGPQGTAGIKPEELAEAQRLAQQQAGAIQRPEDSPAVTEALNREAQALADEMGNQAQQVNRQEREEPPAEQQQGQETPPSAEDSSASGEPSEDAVLRDRIRELRKQHSGSFVELAKTLARKEQTAEERQIALERENERLKALAYGANQAPSLPPYLQGTGQPGYPGMAGNGQSPESSRPAAPETSPSFDWSNPDAYFQSLEQRLAQKMEQGLQSHLTAFSQALTERQRHERYAQMVEQNRDEIAALDRTMREIYSRRKDVYDGLPRDVVLEDLLERARDKVGSDGYVNLSKELSELDGQPSARPGAPPPGAQLTSGTGGGRTRGGGSPRVADYSRTPGFQKLMQSKSDSQDEVTRTMEVLKERGFWENP